MTPNTNGSDWCERLEQAVADGRFLEDPGLWEDHLRACLPCRRLAEGLWTLRERIREAGGPGASGVPAPEVALASLTDAFRRYQRQQRHRRWAAGLLLVVGLGVGVFLAASRREAPPEDPAAYAETLHRRVFPAEGGPRYDLLAGDDVLRGEYLAALDHPHSLVRRAALQALAFSGVEMDSDRLLALLRDRSEDLEAPVEVAGLAEGVRALADALERRRVATLGTILRGLMIQRSRGGESVPSDAVARYVGHPDGEIRRAALVLLELDASYVPGAEVASRLADDELPVRVAAARCLVTRLDADGVDLVIARLRGVPDHELERALVAALVARPEGERLARERIADEDAPVRLGLEHLRALAAADRVLPPYEALVERALEGDDPWAHSVLASLARREAWCDLRVPLQERWAAAAPGRGRDYLGLTLVGWDADCPDAERHHLALDVIECCTDARLHGHLERFATSEDPTVRARAVRLLARFPPR